MTYANATQLHPCGGTGSQFYSMTQLPRYADQLGYVLLYPSTTKQSNCWDVHSAQSLTHGGGGDSEGLANMVAWALTKYNGDASKVFVVGASSGAMMTNVLAGTYPDVFVAGAAWSGAPDQCFAGQTSSTPSTPDQSCAQGQKRYTAQQWGDLARSSYPGYTGRRTRLILGHGTADGLTVYALLGQMLAQWSNVLEVSFTRNLTNTPASGWTETQYGDGTQLVGLSLQGGGHIPAFQDVRVLTFFGLLGGSATTTSRVGPTSTTSYVGPTTVVITSRTSVGITTRSTTTTRNTSQPVNPVTVPRWGQCAGIGYTGPTTCQSPYTCKYSNDWYSQVSRVADAYGPY